MQLIRYFSSHFTSLKHGNLWKFCALFWIIMLMNALKWRKTKQSKEKKRKEKNCVRSFSLHSTWNFTVKREKKTIMKKHTRRQHTHLLTRCQWKFSYRSRSRRIFFFCCYACTLRSERTSTDTHTLQEKLQYANQEMHRVQQRICFGPLF